MKRTIIVIIAAVLLLVGYFSYRAYRQMQDTRAAMEGLETVEVQLGSLTATIDAMGTVRANQSAILTWQTSGAVGSVYVRVGDSVTKGDVLADLEQTSLSQNVILARVDLYQAQQALDDLLNFEMQSALALQELEAAQQALDDLLNPDVELELAQAQVSLLAAQEKLEDAVDAREDLNYQRCLDSTIESYEAEYYLALDQYEQQEEYYNEHFAHLPDTDPDRLNALASLLDTEERVQIALANLNWCLGEATAVEIAEADANVALAEVELSDILERIEELESGPDPVDITLAEARLADAQQEWEAIKDGPSAEEITAAEARIAAAQATLALVDITAPFEGVVTMVESKPGDQVSAGMQVFRVDDLSPLLVDLEVSEVDINQIVVDQSVVLTFDAIQGRQYEGKVIEVAMVGTELQGVVSFKVTVELIGADGGVKPGMTSAVNIVVNQITEALLVPNRAVRVVDGQMVVYVVGDIPMTSESQPQGDEGFRGFVMGDESLMGTKMIEITLGATSYTYSQVIKGDLGVGDRVVLDPPDNIQFGPNMGSGPFGR